MKDSNGKIEYGYHNLSEEAKERKNRRDWTRINHEHLGDSKIARVTVGKYGDVYVDAPSTLSELLW